MTPEALLKPLCLELDAPDSAGVAGGGAAALAEVDPLGRSPASRPCPSGATLDRAPFRGISLRRNDDEREQSEI